LIRKRIIQVGLGLGALLFVFHVATLMAESRDRNTLLNAMSRKTLEDACDNLVIAPSTRSEVALRDGVFEKIVNAHPQLALSINKVKVSGKFTAQNRWDLCREVGVAEQAAAKVKQTLGLEEPPFG
jgi:hypothetical protein